MAAMPLKEADKVEVLTILDNTVDMLMPSTEQSKRFPLPPDPLTCEMLVAEHGFAALVTVSRGNTAHSVLLDAGRSKNGLIHNMDVLEVKPKDGEWQKDPLVHDDQAVVLHVKDKGLVVLTGCGHAGVINTIRHAQRLTGVQQVYAVIGGFHLTGVVFEHLIPETVAAL